MLNLCDNDGSIRNGFDRFELCFIEVLDPDTFCNVLADVAALHAELL